MASKRATTKQKSGKSVTSGRAAKSGMFETKSQRSGVKQGPRSSAAAALSTAKSVVRSDTREATKSVENSWLAAERVGFVADHLGARELARLLGVSSGQPTRWRQGKETPGPENAQAIVDLDYVLARLFQVWPLPAALDWLTTANSFLDGARPIDVVVLRGAGDVADALDAEAAGSFA